VVAGLLVAVGVGVAAWSVLDHGPLAIEGVDLVTEPASGVVSCPGGTVTFVAQIHTNGGSGSIELRWTRPDGVRLDVRTLQVPAGNSDVQARLEYRISGNSPLAADAVLELIRPDALTVTAPMRYNCPSGGGGGD
jgi:hypothetical protein